MKHANSIRGKSLIKKLNILNFIGITLATVFMVLLLVGIYRNADGVAVINVYDVDAAKAIETTMQSTWSQDNNWRPYGPLYYRIVHSLAQGAQTFSSADTETVHHVILMLVSFLSFLGVVISVWMAFKKQWSIFGIASFAALVLAFAPSDAWIRYIYTPHPDLLAALLLSIAYYLLAGFLIDEKSRKNLWGASLLIGLAMGTKLSASLALGGLLVAVIFDVSRKRHLALLLVPALVAIFYFVPGIPQSLEVKETREFLQYASRKITRSADLISILTWMKYLLSQIALPMLVIFVVLRPKFSKINRENIFSWLFFASTVMPYVVLFSKKVLTPHDYYLIPFVPLTLIGVSLVLKSRTVLEKEYLRRRNMLMFVVLALAFFLAVRNELQILSGLTECRNGVHHTYVETQKYLQAGKRVYFTGYTPAPRATVDSTPLGRWDTSFPEFAKSNSDYLIINWNYSLGYLKPEPTAYDIANAEDWYASQEFFKIFRLQQTAKTKDDQIWNKVWDSNCGLEIWEKGL